MLTIAYSTVRRDCRLEWFIASLRRELASHADLKIKLVIVDFYAIDRGLEWSSLLNGFEYALVPPKPTPWQGEHRLTKLNWFAAASARNTALCLAPDGFIAYADDLSVLMPGWLACVREAMVGGYIACGSYKKVKRLDVDTSNGLVTNYVEFPGGIDNRLSHVTADLTDCPGNWLYGCSCAIPVEALLTVNAWPEDLCDGLGSEDYCCGIVLGNAGYKFKYDRRMLTLESEELHHVEPPFKRSDYGVSPDDKSHAALRIALASKRFPNSYDVRELRQSVLAGEPFPIRTSPDRDWFTGKLLCDL